MTVLEGKIAVVTGAAAGVGAASARALDLAGANVVLLDVNESGAALVCAEMTNPALSLKCDVTDEESVAAAFAAIAQRFGRVDVLHNNAGIFLGHGNGNDGPLEGLDLATWRRVLDVNLTGAFLCTRAALPLIPESGGSIIMTASVAGAMLGSIASAYAASKAGLVGFVRSLVLNYASKGIRVNAVCPGSILTDMSKGVRESPELVARLISAVPAGRIALPEDVANLVVFLASPASSYLNGAIIPVEGGLIIN
jgi:NAD(P)-dependent dehydrogenase (short-subunit alcohol dehydrogenase family)